MAEITLDDNKIAVPKRLNVTTFLSEIQKKTKQYLYLINQKEIGIFQNLNDVKKGMWRKFKPGDEICYYYIDPETETEYTVFSDELMKKLGAFPYEGSSVKKPNSQQQLVQQNSFAPSSNLPLPSTPYQTNLLSGIPANQISQNSVLYQTQNLQAPITSDFSFYPSTNYPQQNNYTHPSSSSLPQSLPPSFPQNLPQSLPTSNHPSYPSINEIPRYNNIDINDTIQHFASLISAQPQNVYPNSQVNQGGGFYTQPPQQNLSQQQPNFSSSQTNNNNNNSQQPRMSSKSLQNLNRIQAFLRQAQAPQQTHAPNQQPYNTYQQQVQHPGQQQTQQPQNSQQNYASTFSLNNFQQQIPQGPAQQMVPQTTQQQFQQPIQQNFYPQQGQVQQSQGIQQIKQVGMKQGMGQPQVQQGMGGQGQGQGQGQAQGQQALPIKKTVKPNIPNQIPSVVSQQTVQTDASASGRQKYFPPYQGKKKLLQQQNNATNQNVVPQLVENKFTA